MKKIFVTTISIICIISVLCFNCFATNTSTESEVTISPLIDNTISKIHYVFYNIELGTADYNLIYNGLFYKLANDPNTALGSCYGKTSSNVTFHNYPLFYLSQPTEGAYIYSGFNQKVTNIYLYEVTLDNNTDNQTSIFKFNSVTNCNITYEYTNVINSGFQNSLKILGYSLKSFLQNQYIKLAIGLACGTFFVSFAIFKTKSLIKGY